MKNRFIIPLVFGLAAGTYALYYMYKGHKNNSDTSNNSNNNDNNNDNNHNNDNNDDNDSNNKNNNNNNNCDNDNSNNSNNDGNNNNNNDNKNNNHNSNSNNLNILNGSDIRNGIQDSIIDFGNNFGSVHNNNNDNSDNINAREFGSEIDNGDNSVGENKDGNIQGGEEHQIKLSNETTTRSSATSFEIVLVDDIQFKREKVKSCNNDAQNITINSSVECYPKADSDDEKLLIIEYNAEGIKDGNHTKYGFILTIYPHHWLTIKQLKRKILKLGDQLFLSGGYNSIFTTFQFDPFGKLVNHKLWSEPSFGKGEVKNPMYKEPSNVFGFSSSSSSSSSKGTNFKKPSAKSSSGNSPGTTKFSDNNFSTGTPFSAPPSNQTTATTTPPSNPFSAPTYTSVPNPFGAPNPTTTPTPAATTPPTPATATTPPAPNSTSQPKRKRDD